jgi:FixJ family two-component response regulator
LLGGRRVYYCVGFTSWHIICQPPLRGLTATNTVTPDATSMQKGIPLDEALVIVVDDDSSVREALSSLFRSVGLRTALFPSAQELVAAELPAVPSCLVLDIRMPGLSGLDLQAELGRSGSHVPIIFITGHGDIPMSVQAMKAGAIDFLTKPFRDQDMLDAVKAALERDRSRRREEDALAAMRSRFNTLTPREREVLIFVTSGLMNKQIAGEMGLSEITVKLHRGSVMRKMAAKSLAELVKMAEALGIGRADRPIS